MMCHRFCRRRGAPAPQRAVRPTKKPAEHGGFLWSKTAENRTVRAEMAVSVGGKCGGESLVGRGDGASGADAVAVVAGGPAREVFELAGEVALRGNEARKKRRCFDAGWIGRT